MIREGEPNVTLRYLASGPERKLAVSSFTEGTYIWTEKGGDICGMGSLCLCSETYWQKRPQLVGRTGHVLALWAESIGTSAN